MTGLHGRMAKKRGVMYMKSMLYISIFVMVALITILRSESRLLWRSLFNNSTLWQRRP